MQVELERIASCKEAPAIFNEAFYYTLMGDIARIRKAMEGLLRALTVQFIQNRSVLVGFYTTNVNERIVEGQTPSSIPELLLFTLHLTKFTALNINYHQATALATKLLAFEGFSPSELDNAKSVLEGLLNSRLR